MRLNTLRIDDFGCFRNARLEDLSADLIVIGGPQRAGKTTFMNAFRQFRSGVSRGDNLPPATEEYRVDAEITHHGHRYRYMLTGYAAPSIAPLNDGPEIGAADVFDPVTEQQYRQLYTISLDELRRLPPGIDNTEDLAKVLLGGAYGDIAVIPKLEDEFEKQAHDIGLTRGDPTSKTGDFHGPYQTIRDGMEARTEASNQVDTYNEVTAELDRRKTEKSKVETKLKEKREKRDRLGILREIFEPLQRIDALEAELSGSDRTVPAEFPTHLTDRLEHFETEFNDAVDSLTEAERTFQRDANVAASDAYHEWLLSNEEVIDHLEDKRELLTNTIRDQSDQKQKLSHQRTQLEEEIATHHPDWDSSFSHVREIDASTVSTARVEELAETVSDLRNETDRLKNELNTQETRRDSLDEDLSEMGENEVTEREVTVPKRKPLVIAAAAVTIGTGVGMITVPVIGGLLGLIIIIVGMYAVESTITVEPTVDTEPRRELKSHRTTLEGEIRATEKQLVNVNEERETYERKLERVATEIGLPSDLPPNRIPEYYERVADLKGKISSYQRDQEQWQDEQATLIPDLEEAAELLEDVGNHSWTNDAPLENASALMATINTVSEDLQLARAVRDARTIRRDCIENIDSVLQEWSEERYIDSSTENKTIRHCIDNFYNQAQNANDLQKALREQERHRSQVTNRLDTPSGREIFAPYREDKESWITIAAKVADEFAEVDAIEDEVRDIQREIETVERKRDGLKDQCWKLEKERDTLASEDDLREAQATIDEGRVEFERVGEAYAVNRIAEKMVSRLHERLMEDVVHSLVDDAGKIFGSITQEYDGIEFEGTVQDLEFRAVRGNGSHHGVDELSRATAEQLFLAVRLARIRQTGAELPVVIDDAATNFDPDHISRVFEVIGELSTTNQVFFLTCHPEFVNLTTAYGSSAQYWSLEDGVFTRTDGATVLERQLMID